MAIGNRPTLRADGRSPAQIRPVSFQLGVQKWAEGSCLVRFGDTQVLCAATSADRLPPHLRGKGTGWVTAEYSMLPRATAERTDRESVKGKLGGRTHEIHRLIRRSRRDAVQPEKTRGSAGRGATPSTSRRWASGRSRSTATSSRPTAGRERPRSPAATSRWPRR